MSRPSDLSAFLPLSSFSVFIMEFPRLRGSSLLQAAAFKIRNVYPGDPDTKDLAIVKNGTAKNQWLVFLVDKNRKEHNPYMTTLLLLNATPVATCYMLLEHTGMIEILYVKNGAAVANFRKKITLDGKKDSYISEICKEKIPIYELSVHPEKTDKKGTITILSAEKILKKINPLKYSIFNKTNPVVRRKRRIVAAAVLLCVVASFSVSRMYELSLQKKMAEESFSKQQLAEAAKKEKKLLEKYQNLYTTYLSLVNSKVTSPYIILGLISGCLDSNTHITSLTIQNGQYRFEGTTKDALSIVQKIERDPKLTDTSLHQVKPDKKGRETFSVSGVVPYTYAEPPQSASVQKKITDLENLIEKEQQLAKIRSSRTVSSFSENIRKQVYQFACEIQNYQYTNTNGETELELTVKGTPVHFFSFLEAVSEPSSAIDIASLQLRTAQDDSSLDALIRFPINNQQKSDSTAASVIEYKSDKSSDSVSPTTISKNYITEKKQQPAPVFVKKVQEPEMAPTWYSFVGIIGGGSEPQFVYVKNDKEQIVEKFKLNATGDMTAVKKNDRSYILTIKGRKYILETKQ